MSSVGLWIAVTLVGASVSLILASTSKVFATALRRYRERYGLVANRDRVEFLFCVDRQGIRILAAGAAVLAGLAGWAIGGGALGLVAGVVGWLGPGLSIEGLRKRWRRGVEAELVSALEGLSASLRGGLSLNQALELISTESRGPLGRELRLLIREVKVGHSLEDSLEALADRVESSELDLAVAAIALARQQGGNLAELLGKVTENLRERFRLEGKVLSLTAQTRMQGRIVAAMPLCLGVLLWWMRPDLVDPMVRHPFGQLLLVVVALLETAGLFWMGRLARVDV